MGQAQVKTKRAAIENPINDRIGENLRFYRKSRGVTLKKLSEAIGLTYQQLQKYEGGQNRLKIDTVVDIAAYFGESPLDMLSILLSEGEQVETAKTLLSEGALELVGLYDTITDKKIRKSLMAVLKGMAER